MSLFPSKAVTCSHLVITSGMFPFQALAVCLLHYYSGLQDCAEQVVSGESTTGSTRLSTASAPDEYSFSDYMATPTSTEELLEQASGTSSSDLSDWQNISL